MAAATDNLSPRLSTLSLASDCSPLLLLPSEIFENIIQRLDFQALKSLRSCCKKLIDPTARQLFGIIRIRFRHHDLACIQCIASSESLRYYVNTVVYVAGQYRDCKTFGHWKATIGTIDPNVYASQNRAPLRLKQMESPAWTLEHAQWRSYRRYQQIKKEQTDMHDQGFDDDVLLEALPRFPNLKHAYFVMQEDDRREHSQTSAILRSTNYWKPSHDAYQHWGSTQATPHAPRFLPFLRALKWPRPAALEQKLESLVISGFHGGTLDFEKKMTVSDASFLSGLRYLTLDFRNRSSRNHVGVDYALLPGTLQIIMNTARLLESLDVFMTGEHPYIGLETFDVLVSRPRLKRVTLGAFAMEEKQLAAFVMAYRISLRTLKIVLPKFITQGSHPNVWKDYVLSCTDEQSLVKYEPSEEELIHLYLNRHFGNVWWLEPHRREAAAVMWKNKKHSSWTSARRYWLESSGEVYVVSFPTDHAFDGGSGRYNATQEDLTIEWPEDRTD